MKKSLGILMSCLAWMCLLAGMTMTAGIEVVYAEETDSCPYALQAGKDSDYCYLQLVASEDNAPLGIMATFNYDRESFSFAGVDVKNGFSFMANAEKGIVSMDALNPVSLQEGEILCTVKLQAQDSIDPAESYPVSAAITEAYSEAMVDYSWVPATLEISYSEEQAEEIAYEPEHNDQIYVVTYLDADGSILSQQSVDVGEAIEEPFEPEREGYTFTGWEHDGSYFDAEKPLKSDTTLTATWAEGDDAEVPDSTAADTSEEAEGSSAGGVGVIGAVAAAVIVILLVWRIAVRRKSS